MAACNTTRQFSCPPPSNITDCKSWDLTMSKDQCFIENQAQEALNIAGAQLNVYKLLGVHEQRLLLDVTGKGAPISSGDHPTHPATNAFNTYATHWTSSASGDNVVARSYIGYDFGEVKLLNGRKRYGVETAVRYNISTIRIKQSSTASQRVTKARVERSDDGTVWYGVSVITLPDDDALNTISFKQSVPSRYWRLRPLIFAGAACDAWSIQALEMHEYDATMLGAIEDQIFFENRNRDYNTQPIRLKGYYELLSPQTILMRFGAGITNSYQIKVLFSTCISVIGRPIVVGDIIELPSETQYTADLTPVKRYVQVTDVTWDAGSYTPGWVPIMLLVTASPAIASQETQAIFGDLSVAVDGSGLFSGDDGNNTKYQDFSAISHTIKNDARTEVPELGSEGSNTIREFTPEEIALADPIGNLRPSNFNRVGLYVEDAMPQNGAPYSEGPDFPTSPQNLDYHRMTYVGLSEDVPARLYRYSAAKSSWVYLETDRRAQYDETKPRLQEYTSSPTATPSRAVK